MYVHTYKLCLVAHGPSTLPLLGLSCAAFAMVSGVPLLRPWRRTSAATSRIVSLCSSQGDRFDCTSNGDKTRDIVLAEHACHDYATLPVATSSVSCLAASTTRICVPSLEILRALGSNRTGCCLSSSAGGCRANRLGIQQHPCAAVLESYNAFDTIILRTTCWNHGPTAQS